MILLSFSHWGMTPLPDNDSLGNVIVYQDGSVERLELEETMYMNGRPRGPLWSDYDRLCSLRTRT
jgi:hypothetical protein